MPDTRPPRDDSSTGKSPGLRFTKYEGAALLLGVGLAHLFFLRAAGVPLAYDDYDYAMAGRSILENGIFSKFYGSEIRTYGYPLFLSLVHRLIDVTGLPLKLIVFEMQLLLYLLSAVLLRFELCKRNETLGRILFAAIAVNFYPLLYTAEVLTESLSVSALLVAAASWLHLQREPSRFIPMCIGSAAAAAAVIIRPANLFLLGTWIIGCLIVLGPLFFKGRAPVLASSRIAAVVIIVGAVLLPQGVNNARNWQRHTPLTAADLQLTQQRLSVEKLKYATALPPAPAPEVFYKNPLADGTAIDPSAPLQWYVAHPFRGALTVGLHIFNMTDQDLLFTYAYDLNPWYRIPHGLLNHAIVALGLIGFVLMWRRAAGRGARADLEAAGLLTMLALSNCAIYAATVVEMRFGLTLLSILVPCAAYGLVYLRTAEARLKSTAAGAVAAYVVGALLLSAWVRSQASQITAT